MSTIVTRFDHARKLTNAYGLPLATATLKATLITSAYTLNTAHTAWSDISANEVATGLGYTTGGVTLTNPVVTNSKVDFDDVKWTALTKTFRAAIVRAVGTYNSITDPVLLHILLDDTAGGTDIVVAGSDYLIIWNVLGAFSF